MAREDKIIIACLWIALAVVVMVCLCGCASTHENGMYDFVHGIPLIGPVIAPAFKSSPAAAAVASNQSDTIQWMSVLGSMLLGAAIGKWVGEHFGGLAGAAAGIGTMLATYIACTELSAFVLNSLAFIERLLRVALFIIVVALIVRLVKAWKYKRKNGVWPPKSGPLEQIKASVEEIKQIAYAQDGATPPQN